MVDFLLNGHYSWRTKLSPPSIMESSTSIKMQTALIDTLTDLQVRSHVEDCMSDLLVDLETTFNLQQQLVVYTNQQTTDRLVLEQKSTILDAEAERLLRDQQQDKLADAFVSELMTVSRELQTLLHWKKQNEHKVNSYDELLAKLVQTEEELEAANRISYNGEPKERQPTVLVKEKSAETKSAEDPSTQEISASQIQEDTKEPEPVPIQEQNIEETKPAALDVKPAEEEDTTTDLNEVPRLEEVKEPAAAAVVLIDEEEPEEDNPSFAELDMEILMNIFGYLDPMDILNTAQINVAMYTRVDSIFGIADDGVPKPSPAPAKPSPPTPPPPPQPEAQTKPQAVVTKPTSVPITAAAPTAAAAPANESAGNGFFSMLQPRGVQARPPPARAGKGQQLNASLAKSMASKLTDAELAAILTMTDRLSKLDKEVNFLRNEKEELTAKLDGTEAVKQFLISKCREVELKFKRREEDEIKVTQQIASDQEVIAFLDSRVQELEMSADNNVKGMNSAREELNALKVSSNKKTVMLNDMLKYEREKLREEETDWKATKKVLVKEVKNCRAQILALQAERDGYREQNEMLKRAIVSTGKNGNSASPNR